MIQKKNDFRILQPESRILFLFDYDGTLTDFKKKPEESLLSRSTRSILLNLRKKFPVVIVTGRFADDLLRLSRLKNFSVIGTHGFEARNLPHHLRFAPSHLERRYQDEAARMWKAVQKLPQNFPGIHIEKKPFSSTLHYRGAGLSPEKIKKLEKIFTHLCRKNITPRLWTFQKGKQMLEVMPKGFSKGKSVRILLKEFPDYKVVSAGDDITDISVFKVLGKKDLRIAIGNRIPKKDCDIRLKTPKDLLSWLKVWTRRTKPQLPSIRP